LKENFRSGAGRGKRFLRVTCPGRDRNIAASHEEDKFLAGNS